MPGGDCCTHLAIDQKLGGVAQSLHRRRPKVPVPRVLTKRKHNHVGARGGGHKREGVGVVSRETHRLPRRWIDNVSQKILSGEGEDEAARCGVRWRKEWLPNSTVCAAVCESHASSGRRYPNIAVGRASNFYGAHAEAKKCEDYGEDKSHRLESASSCCVLCS